MCKATSPPLRATRGKRLKIFSQEGKNCWGWGRGSCHTAEVALTQHWSHWQGLVQMGNEGRSKRQFQKDAHDWKYFNTTEPQFLVQTEKKKAAFKNPHLSHFQGHASHRKVNGIHINRIKTFFTVKYKTAFLVGFGLVCLFVCLKAQGFFSILTAVAYGWCFSRGTPKSGFSAWWVMPAYKHCSPLRGAGQSFTGGLQFKREKGS